MQNKFVWWGNTVHGASVDVLSKSERRQLCSATKEFCKSACNSSTDPTVACNDINLVWNCNCLRKENSSLALFPIPDKMCHMDLQLCQASCRLLNNHADLGKTCHLQCTGSFPCGTPKAPIYNGTEYLRMTADHRYPRQRHRTSSGATILKVPFTTVIALWSAVNLLNVMYSF